MSAICLGFGVLSVLFFLIPTARKLQGEPVVVLRQCRGSDRISSSCPGEQVEDIYLILSDICVVVKVVVLYRTIYCVVPQTCYSPINRDIS